MIAAFTLTRYPRDSAHLHTPLRYNVKYGILFIVGGDRGQRATTNATQNGDTKNAEVEI